MNTEPPPLGMVHPVHDTRQALPPPEHVADDHDDHSKNERRRPSKLVYEVVIEVIGQLDLHEAVLIPDKEERERRWHVALQETRARLGDEALPDVPKLKEMWANIKQRYQRIRRKREIGDTVRETWWYPLAHHFLRQGPPGYGTPRRRGGARRHKRSTEKRIARRIRLDDETRQSLTALRANIGEMNQTMKMMADQQQRFHNALVSILNRYVVHMTTGDRDHQ